MTTKRPLLLLSAWLLAAGIASAQGPPPPAKPAETPAGRQMYEDIEVMRRLLGRRMEKVGITISEEERLQRLLILNQRGQKLPPGAPAAIDYGFPAGSTWTAPVFPSSVAGCLEGVYLKGQGVVFTTTLPPTRRDPRPTDRVEAKPASEWDRVRKEIRGEKVEQLSEAEKKETPLAELLLGVLAENGHRMSGLGDNEGITIVITFRELRHLPLRQNFNTWFDPNSLTWQLSSYASAPPAATTGTTTPAPSAAGDYELLADLHAKQGKHEDALKVLVKAIAEAEHAANPPAKEEMARLMHKAAQEFAATGDPGRAREMLDRAAKLKVEAKAAPAAPLPAKLILSASKKLLDQAGAKKISFEEFKKLATVEYLTFPAEEKKPEK